MAKSIEDRESLRQMWAKLLAAAMDPSRAKLVRLSLISLLKKMDPLEELVRLLAAAVPVLGGFGAGASACRCGVRQGEGKLDGGERVVGGVGGLGARGGLDRRRQGAFGDVGVNPVTGARAGMGGEPGCEGKVVSPTQARQQVSRGSPSDVLVSEGDPFRLIDEIV